VISRGAVEAIEAEAAAMVARTGQPGLAIALTDRESTLLVRTCGAADLARGTPVSPGTLFEIGSIGKTFTAVLVMQLAEAGRIELAAPVERYLPWFRVAQPTGTGPITPAHLLTHTAGIVAGVDATPEGAFQVWALRDLPTPSAPGQRLHYSNVGYKALGLVLEAVEGRPYRELVRNRILEPLGMAASAPAITNEVRARLAVGYEYLHDDRLGYRGAPLAPATWLETDTADGCIASTAEDMCAFARLLLRAGEAASGRLLSQTAFAQMATARAGTGDYRYGYGLEIRERDGRRLIGHGGGMVGYAAALQADPDAGIAAVVLQNGPAAAPGTLARAAIVLAHDGPVSPPTHGAASTDLPAGRYRPTDGAGEEIELRRGEHGPLLRTPARDIPLEEWNDRVYAVADSGWDRFPLEIAGSVRAPELWHGARRYLPAGVSSGPEPEPPGVLRAIAGHYRSHNPWTPHLRVVLRGERPWLIFPGAPDGFLDSQPLTPTADGGFRCGEDPGNPESVRFDTLVDGRALRAWLSGWPYYRVG
jgi:D-alanyl-D-alanine carboxypeptidase